METSTISLIIKKRGRKYFECLKGKYTAKLVINDVSSSLEIDAIVKLEVINHSTKTKYGSSLKFEPVSILEIRDAKEAYELAVKRNKAIKWLNFAEKDVDQGKIKTNAILIAFDLAKDHIELKDRLLKLKERVDNNQKAWGKYKSQKKQESLNVVQNSKKILFALDQLPALNMAINFKGRVLVFTSTGRRFRINEDHPSYEGSHLLGYEGDLGCYAYYREATEDEIVQPNIYVW